MVEKFELSIISKHKDFDGKAFRTYDVDNIEQIGVFGDEPFSIRFKNNTSEQVQIRVSLDGTDIATGEKSLKTSLSATGMWVVGAYQTVNFEAWAETTERGRRFVFTNAGSSVAVHTHGDLSDRGLIEVAVFTEGYKQPYWTLGGVTIKPLVFDGWKGNHYYDMFNPLNPYVTTCDVKINGSNINGTTIGGQGLQVGDSINASFCNSSPMVGAGEAINQKIVSAAGLTQPVYDRTIKIRYEWWDELQVKLEQKGYTRSDRSDRLVGNEKPLANLGTTPSIGSNTLRPTVEMSRFIG